MSFARRRNRKPPPSVQSRIRQSPPVKNRRVREFFGAWKTRLALTLALFLTASLGVVFWVSAHSVAQIQTTVYFAPETVQLIRDRALAGTPGLKAGDTVCYIIQFTPVENGGATVGAGGYITAYIPSNVVVTGASIVQPSGGSFTPIAPDLPGPISNGWGPRGRQTFGATGIPPGAGPTYNGVYDSLCGPSGANQPIGQCNGSLADIYADTGIFYSTDTRTAVFTSPDMDGRIRQGINGYNINPTGAGQINPIIGQAAATTHNQCDAAQTNAFGSTAGAITGLANPKSSQGILITAGKIGQGATPFNAGSAVAGPDTGYKLDNTGNVGPWQRVYYSGSRIGTPTGPAMSATRTYPAAAGSASDSSTYIGGAYTGAGWFLSDASPLPVNTNAVRWAVGGLTVGQVRYSKLCLRLTADPPLSGIILNSEVFGGDSAQAGGKAGNDNPWRYHVPSVANNNSNLYLLKEVIAVNGTPSSGATIPAGATIRYRMTYLNTGITSQTGLTLQDTLPTETPANSVSNIVVVSGPNILPSPNPPVLAAGGATFSFPFPGGYTLNPGLGGVVEFDVQTNAAAGDVVTNQAKLASAAIPGGITSMANSIVSSTANLQITKSVLPAAIAVNGTVRYTITVTNTGTATASNLVVYDFLPTTGGALDTTTRFNLATTPNFAFTNIPAVTPTTALSPTQIPYTSENRQEIKWDFTGITPSPPTLAAGASFSISFDVTAGSNVPISATPYTNDARVNYNNSTVASSTTITATSPVLVTRPNIALVKTVSPSGDQPPETDLTYDIVLTNTGIAAHDLVVVDPIPSDTDFKLGSANLNPGTSGLSATISYSEDGGTTWTYTPLSGGGGAPTGYDRNVNRIRWILTPSLSATTPNNTATVSFTVKIR